MYVYLKLYNFMQDYQQQPISNDVTHENEAALAYQSYHIEMSEYQDDRMHMSECLCICIHASIIYNSLFIAVTPPDNYQIPTQESSKNIELITPIKETGTWICNYNGWSKKPGSLFTYLF